MLDKWRSVPAIVVDSPANTKSHIIDSTMSYFLAPLRARKYDIVESIRTRGFLILHR